MKKLSLLVPALIYFAVIILSAGVNAASAAEQKIDRDAMMKKGQSLLDEGQMMIDKGNKMKDGKLDKSSLIEEGNRMAEEGKIMAVKGKEMHDKLMQGNGERMIRDSMRLKQGRADIIKRTGDLLIEKGRQKIKEGQKIMEEAR